MNDKVSVPRRRNTVVKLSNNVNDFTQICLRHFRLRSTALFSERLPEGREREFRELIIAMNYAVRYKVVA